LRNEWIPKLPVPASCSGNSGTPRITSWTNLIMIDKKILDQAIEGDEKGEVIDDDLKDDE